MRRSSIAAALLLVANAVHAQSTKPAGDEGTARVIVALPNALQWGPAPDILPAGAKLAVIEGDPGKAGEFTMRLSMPAGYRIPPHFHPATEHVTVLQGTFYVGMGDKFDATQVSALPVGTFGAIPAGHRHFALTKEEVIIQLHGAGPWSLTYVNPTDRPKADR